MQAHVIYSNDPFHPMRNRVVKAIKRKRKLQTLAPVTDKPFICLVNGVPVLRSNWQQTVKDGDLVSFVILPQGGGGGGGSNPLKMVLSIAVMVIAPYAAGMLAPSLGVMSEMGKMALQAGIGMVGSMLVNAILPPPKPPGMNNSSSGANFAAASPTYNLSAQGNTARIDGAIPEHYGRMLAYPDFAAIPYVEYGGNEQYLYQLLCVGVGKYDIEEIRIDDTSIASFEEIEYEIIQPYETIDLFPFSVTTATEVAGQELKYTETLGPFIVNAEDTLATRIAIDLVCPRGLYYANDAGGLDSRSVSVTIEAQQIDNDGVAIGSWVTLGTASIGAATTTPQRRTFSYTLTTQGRYQVKATRSNLKDDSSRSGHEVDWAGLRAYLVSDTTFGNTTMIAIKARATNNLSSQSSRQFNVIATRRLNTWDGAWSSSEVATRSPAWAIASCCKSVGLPDSRIALDELQNLAAISSTRGDYFDGRFDQTMTFWEALTKICQVARVKPYMQGGIIHFRRDEAVAIPVAMFSMRNIIKNSFSIEFITPTEDTADSVELSYFDSDFWKPRRVTGKLAGGTSLKPAKVEMFGCTNRAHAYREAVYMAAANMYRRTIIKFSTDMEGFIPGYGDLISVSHDLPQWGQSGEIIAYDATLKIIKTSEPVTFGTGTNYVGLRRMDGSLAGPYVVTAGVDAYHIVLAIPPDFTIYTGTKAERTHYTFGYGSTWTQQARVISLKPKGFEQVEIIAVNEDASVHTADLGITAPAVVSSQLPKKPTVPVIEGLQVWSQTGFQDRMLITWKPSVGAENYYIEQSADGVAWTRSGDTAASSYTTNALYGASTLIRVCGIGLTQGAWVTVNYGSFADYMWNAVDTTLMWNAVDTTTIWNY